MGLELSGKKVISTVGSRDLGRAALELCASEGTDIAFFFLNPEDLAETKRTFYDMTDSRVELGRFCTLEDAARTADFVSSPPSNYTTGTNNSVDGDYTKRIQF